MTKKAYVKKLKLLAFFLTDPVYKSIMNDHWYVFNNFSSTYCFFIIGYISQTDHKTQIDISSEERTKVSEEDTQPSRSLLDNRPPQNLTFMHQTDLKSTVKITEEIHTHGETSQREWDYLLVTALICPSKLYHVLLPPHLKKVLKYILSIYPRKKIDARNSCHLAIVWTHF